jgi:hypothetical protein
MPAARLVLCGDLIMNRWIRHLAICAVSISLASPGWCSSYVVCSSLLTGEWGTPSTWALSTAPSVCKAGVPGSGDTVTITSGAVVTVSDVESFGLNHTTASDDCLVKAGGTLQINPGGVLNAYGNIDLERGSNFFVYGGTFSFITPQAGTNYSTKFLNTGSGSNPVVRICAEATCTSAGGGNAVFTAAGPGTGAFSAGSNGYVPTFSSNYATFSNLGSGTVNAVNYSIGSAVNTISLKNTLFINDGYVLFNIGTATAAIFSADRVAFTNCVNTNGGWGPTCAEFRGSAPSSSPRLLTNISAYNVAHSAHPQSFVVSLYGAQVGKSVRAGDSSNVSGFSGYNVLLASGYGNPIIVRSSFIVEDQGANGDSCYYMAPGNHQLWQDQICLSHLPNQHEWVGVGAPGTLGANLAQRLFCDGDGYMFIDAGDLWDDPGVSTLRDSLGINACGTLITAGFSTQTYTVLNNTIYQSFGATIGETTGSPNQIVAFRNNLITWSFGSNSGGINAFNAFQRQSNLSLDYNVFFGMPGSGDPDVCAQVGCPKTLSQLSGTPSLLPDPSLGGIVSYVRFPVTAVTGLSAKVLTAINGTAISCSTCDFVNAGVQAGDFFLDNSLSAKPYVTISSVATSTSLVLSAPIPGWKAGNSFDVRPSYWATPGFVYGDSKNGSHDRHVNPNFVDTTRTLCTWLTINGGYAPCGHTGDLTATSGTTSSTIVCSSCDFVGWAITANDLAADYSSGGVFRGTVQVVSVTDTHTITVSPALTSMVSGDHFTFVTATRTIGQKIVAASGYDYLGNPVTFDNKWSVFSAMNHLTQGFTPQNLALKGAGSPQDGSPDIGAVAVGQPSNVHHRGYWRR